MEWYLKKEDGEVYGPVAIQVLVQWSTEGRLSPNDSISADQENWQLASDLPELGMDWLVNLKDGEEYGPLHMMALAHLVVDDVVQIKSTIRRKSTQETNVLSEALVGVLMDRNASIQANFDAISIEMMALEEEIQTLRASPNPEEGPLPDTGPRTEFRRRFKELGSRADILEKENTKWKHMYETEVSNSKQKVAQFETRIEELRKSDAEGRTQLEETARRLRQLEHSYATLLKAAEAASGADGKSEVARQFGDLLEAYGQMSHSYDKLHEQLTDKSKESERLVRSRQEAEEHASQRIRDMENILQREQKEADTARQQLIEVQEAHYQLVKTFRDMNDRFIQRRQEWSEQQVEEPSTGKHRITRKSSGSKSRRGPRIRLNR